MPMSTSYKDAGVDIEKGDALVSRIKEKVRKTCGARVISGVGGFACLYDIDGDRMLAAGTDGVGTKLMIAQSLGIHNSIGIDLVAMCANDILCTGAKGLFFMDYLATGALDLGVAEQIIDGVVEGCSQAGLALIGGETAEMPGMYAPGKYDLAGFAVGEVFKKTLIDGSKIQEGDTIIGIASTGIHSNGLSLARKLIEQHEAEWRTLLTPTAIYTADIDAMDRSHINGLAHITGGGLSNIARINTSFDYVIDSFPKTQELPSIFKTLSKRSGLSPRELFRTFNMGIGMTVITSEPEAVLSACSRTAWKIGQVKKGTGDVLLNTSEYTQEAVSLC
jgi:phosphoribosylformylglycinamidine cyclo-ligase